MIKDGFFYLAFVVDFTSRLNDLDQELPGKDKLIHGLVSDINALKMKLKPFISQ